MNTRIALFAVCGLLWASVSAEAQSLSKRDTLPGHGQPITALGYSADGAKLAVGDGYLSAVGGRGVYRVWDMDLNEVRTLFVSAGPVRSVAFTPDAKVGVMAGTADIQVVDLVDHVRLARFDDGQRDFTSMVLTQDGKHVVSAAGGLGGEGTYVWKLDLADDDHELVTVIRGRYTCVALKPDGSQIAMGAADGTLTLLSTETWKKGATYGEAEEDAAVTKLAYSRDGQKLFAWRGIHVGGTVHDANGEALSTLKGKFEKLNDAIFLADGNTLVTAGLTIRLWNAQTGEPIGEPIREHTRDVNCLALSPDGKTLASGGDWDQQVILWDTP